VALAFVTKGAAFSYGGGWGEYLSESLTSMLGMAGTALLLVVTGIAWIIWRFNPVFNVPKAPKLPNISMPSFGKKQDDLIKSEASLMIDDSLQPENNNILGAPETKQAIKATQQNEKPPLLPPTSGAGATGPHTGLTLNELYAMGKADALAKKRFETEEPSNPLEQQSIQSSGNSFEDDDLPFTVVVPPAEKAIQPDPINTLSVSDKAAVDEKGFPLLLINPIPVEKSGITVIQPDMEKGILAANEGTSLVPDLEKNVPKNIEEQVVGPENIIPPTPISYPVTVVPDSELELEIKPPVTELNLEDENEIRAKPSVKKVEDLPPYDPMLELKGYKYPTLDLLDTHGSEQIVTDQNELETHKNQILNTLKNYDISIQRISATVGPTVTLYEIVPAPGVRISRIKNLEDDIALSLAALGIRIIAPIPGKGTIGIEVPNVRKTVVSMRTLLASEKFQNTHFSLPIAIGKKIDNEYFVVDLASMPHLLMAGATGQGKSVGINAVIVSLLYKKHPSQLKLVLVDPKKVELSLYRAIEKHFLAKLPGEEESIITDTKKVVHTLNALCIEMDNRYDLLKEAGVRNIKEYNEKFVKRRLNPEKGHQFLPFIVLVIDEFADLIMTAGKEIEMPIARLAQLARAVGIHLIIATQRPSVNIITGTIKANFPSRVAFKVSSKIDSRTILDAGGAEQLIGKGDLLISHNGELIRLQCAFVDTPEVERVCEAIGSQRGYPEAFLLPEYIDEKEMESREFDVNDRDSLFEDAARLIIQHQQGSTSLIQRRMKLGYNRAGRLMDQLEQAGIVGPNQGSKPRDVLVKTDMDLQEILGRF
jgi:S-DNA-T family DNA segregation ATPase FtsK/SpoIIIE